jgi:hypothetical protein
MDFKTAFLSMNPNVMCFLLVMLVIATNLFMYIMEQFSDDLTNKRISKLEDQVNQVYSLLTADAPQMGKEETAPICRPQFQPPIAPGITIPPEDTNTILKWYGLTEKDLSEVNKTDDSKMIDGVPVLGKGVYNRKHDPVAQLKGDAYQGYYD